ncbi:MAG: hypothetical protein WCH46_06220 [bacterium]
MKSKNKPLLILGAVVALIIILYFAFRKDSNQHKTVRSSEAENVIAPETFHGIPREGIGGDPDLNRQKNRWSIPADVREYRISQIIGLPHTALDMMESEHRKKWSVAARDEAASAETKGVRVVGYLSKVREQGPEACNGKSEIYDDFHLWITESPYQNKNEGIVIEATPFWKEHFPSWQLITFEKLAFEHARVRVTGWLLWDQEHGDEVWKSRGSLWEIHPITKFEIYTGDGWHELADKPM